MTEPPRPVVLHSSWRGRAVAVTAPAALFGFGGYGLVAGGIGVVSTVALALALVLAVVVVVDYPLHVVFGPDGIERRCLARREHLVWGRVSCVVRPAYRSPVQRVMRQSTGLVAELGKRRYLLTDKMESKAEYEAVLRGMGEWARGVRAEVTQPPDTAAPTWLYKRRRGGSSALVDHL